MNTISAIAVALHEASQPAFKDYAQRIINNAQVMANEFLALGYELVTGGTDNHMVVIDFSKTDIDGRVAEKTLDEIGISTSKSTIPDDPNPPFKPSGLRVGIQAMTTRGITPDDVKKLVKLIDQALNNHTNAEKLQTLKQEIKSMATNYPLPN